VTVATADIDFGDRTTLSEPRRTRRFSVQTSSVDARYVLYGDSLGLLTRLTVLLTLIATTLWLFDLRLAFAFVSLLVGSLALLTLYFVVRFHLTRPNGLPAGT
jgi:hypothetical protein